MILVVVLVLPTASRLYHRLVPRRYTEHWFVAVHILHLRHIVRRVDPVAH